VVVRLGGMVICETDHSLRVLETFHPPTYYLPRDAFVDGALQPADGSSFCEWKGMARYLDLRAGDRVAARAGWFYPMPTSGFADLVGHVALYPGLMDDCQVNGERVQPQPGGFYGGWITSTVSGPFKGIPGSGGW
jgi:uncharacterized protein (DUF427 family)